MGDIGGVAQAGADVITTQMTNQANQENLRTQDQFNAQQAQLARQFDASQQSNAQAFAGKQQDLAEAYNTQMSDTAVQRRAQDISAAGFNPLLAVGQLGGASTPQMSAPGSPVIGGPSATSAGLPNLRPMAAGIAGDLTAGKQQALLDAQAKNVGVDTQTKQAELPYAAAQSRAAIQQLDAQSEQLFRSAQTLVSQYDYNEQSAAKLAQDRSFAAQLQPLLVQAQSLNNQRLQYGMPELQTESRFWSGPLAIGVYAGQQGSKVAGAGGAIATGLQMLQSAFGAAGQVPYRPGQGPGGSSAAAKYDPMTDIGTPSP